MTLDQDKRSVEVPLGRCYDKKSMVLLDLYSPRSDSMVAPNHNKKSSIDDLSADEVLLVFCSTRSDSTASLGRFKKSTMPTRSVLELSRDEAKAKVKETIAIVDRWYDSDRWKPWSSPSSEDEVRRRRSHHT